MLETCSRRPGFFQSNGIFDCSLASNLDLISPEQAKRILTEVFGLNLSLPEVISKLRIELMSVKCEDTTYRIYNGIIIGELPCGYYGCIDYEGRQHT